MPDTSDKRIEFEIFLGFSSMLIIVGSLAPWNSLVDKSIFVLESWHTITSLIGGLLSLSATIISYQIPKCEKLQRQRPHVNAGLGGVGGIWAFLSGVLYWIGLESSTVPEWGLFITVLGGMLAILSSIGLYDQESPTIPKGLS